MIGTGFALVSASRGFLFNFVIVFFLVLLNTGQARNWYQSKRVLSRILTVGPLSLAFGFFLVIQGKAYIGVISSFFRGEHSALPELVLDLHPIWVRFLKEFSHPSHSLLAAISKDVEPNLFHHFFVAPLHLIPSKILGLDKDIFRISEFNTKAITGSEVGGIPPGLLASLWYGGGLLGVLIGSLIFGILLGSLQKHINRLSEQNINFMPLGIVFSYNLAIFVNNGDPSVWLKDSFSYFIFIFIALFSYKYISYMTVRTVKNSTK